jgi:CBS domain-containing protein/uncharacterized protein (DUF2267 family)
MSSIAPYIYRKVVVLRADSTAMQAARAMEEHGIGCVLVSDSESHIIGILTDRDIACRLVAHEASGTNSILSIMTPNPVLVDEGAEIKTVVQLMVTHGIRRIPVIHPEPNGRQRCVGLISLDDLIGSREIDDLQLMRIVRGQIKKKALGSSEYRSWLKINAPGQSSDTSRPEENLYQVISMATEQIHGRSKSLVYKIASSLVGRLNDTAAVHFIVSLPEDLQRDLAELPAGPDPKITVRYLVTQVIDEFGLSEAEALSKIIQACRALEEWIGFQRFAHIKAQLNDDFRALFFAAHETDRWLAA